MAHGFPVDVACAKISGEVLTLALHSDSLVRDLKRAIADHAAPGELQVHPICQKLMLEGRALEDTELLGKLCEPAPADAKAQLEVGLLLTVEGILATFGLGNPDLTTCAIKVAGTLAACDEQVLGALCRCTRWGLFSCTRRDWQQLALPRAKAAEAISSLAQAGHEAAVDALIRCLASPSREVRETAMDGLLTVPTDKALLRKKLREHVESILQLAEDGVNDNGGRGRYRNSQWQVLPALEILGQHSPPEDEDALAVLGLALNLAFDARFDSVDRQILAVRIVLSSLGHVGWACAATSSRMVQHFVKFCSVVMSPIQLGRFSLVKDPHSHWERTVPAVAKQMCSHDGKRLTFRHKTLQELISLLSHAGQLDPAFRSRKTEGFRGRERLAPNAASARRAAIELLSSCANASVVERTLPLLQHPWDEVRTAAVTVIGQKAAGDETVLAVLAGYINSGPAALAQAAVTALGQVGKSNEQVIATLRSCLSHADVWVRKNAPGALLSAVGPSAAEELRQLCAQADVEVAEASLDALPEDALAAAAALDHQDPYIQVLAGKRLLKLHHMPSWENGGNDITRQSGRQTYVELLRVDCKREPEVPSTEIFAAVQAVAKRRELSETKRICIGFLCALGILREHQEARDFLQQLIEEKLWHPLREAKEAVRLMHEKPKPELRKTVKVKWTSSMLPLQSDDLPVPSREEENREKFWDSYKVDGFVAHIGQKGTLEIGEAVA